MSEKHSLEHVRLIIEEDGSKLEADEYINNKTKLKIVCPKGHTYRVRFNDFQQGHRCPTCADVKKPSYKQVKSFIEKDVGYLLKSKNYKNNSTKLQIMCPSGHLFEMTFNNFRSGYRCPVCAGNATLTFEQVKNFVDEADQCLLSTEYKNNHTKLCMVCPKGHIYNVSFNSFKAGHRCPECGGTKKLSYEQVKLSIEKDGCGLLSTDYENSKTKLRIRCPHGHIFEKSFNSFQHNTACPVCVRHKKTSKAEKDVLSYVESIYKGTIKPNDQTQVINPKTGYGLELDIYLPEINKAIEYNGTYWHSTPYQKYKDEQKVIQCQQKGIDLLVILEEEWRQDKEACINRIKAFIGAIK